MNKTALRSAKDGKLSAVKQRKQRDVAANSTGRYAVKVNDRTAVIERNSVSTHILRGQALNIENAEDRQDLALAVAAKKRAAGRRLIPMAAVHAKV